MALYSDFLFFFSAEDFLGITKGGGSRPEFCYWFGLGVMASFGPT
jgi:hypothetical protein